MRETGVEAAAAPSGVARMWRSTPAEDRLTLFRGKVGRVRRRRAISCATCAARGVDCHRGLSSPGAPAVFLLFLLFLQEIISGHIGFGAEILEFWQPGGPRNSAPALCKSL